MREWRSSLTRRPLLQVNAIGFNPPVATGGGSIVVSWVARSEEHTLLVLRLLCFLHRRGIDADEFVRFHQQRFDGVHRHQSIRSDYSQPESRFASLAQYDRIFARKLASCECRLCLFGIRAHGCSRAQQLTGNLSRRARPSCHDDAKSDHLAGKKKCSIAEIARFWICHGVRNVQESRRFALLRTSYF